MVGWLTKVITHTLRASTQKVTRKMVVNSDRRKVGNTWNPAEENGRHGDWAYRELLTNRHKEEDSEQVPQWFNQLPHLSVRRQTFQSRDDTAVITYVINN